MTAELRHEKADLEVRLLSRFEDTKAWEEVSNLQENVTLAQSAISSLREQIDKGCVEKLALYHEI